MSRHICSENTQSGKMSNKFVGICPDSTVPASSLKFIFWHTGGSNILNPFDKMANGSSGWDAVQCVGRLESSRGGHTLTPQAQLQVHQVYSKLEASAQEASRQTSQGPLSEVGTVRNTV